LIERGLASGRRHPHAMIGYDAKGWKVICYSRDKKKLARELNYWPGYAGK
jgi:hypothetical protein